ncbi:hypothetical protein KL938_004394 [Ogataea parapolymorpha]|nr:hypothetical protein KL938_004394 [Ogataea parapolymorpha]
MAAPSTDSQEKASKASKASSELDPETVELSRSASETSSTPKGKNLVLAAYCVLVFAAFVETFAGDSTSGLDSYATSHFNAHALISTADVTYKITAIISYPIMAKLNDLFGRSEGFGFSVLVYTMAYVLYAACQNVQTYVCAEILYAVGKIGYRVFQQVFIADTSSLINRGLMSQLPDAIAAVPSLYVGSVIQDAFIEHATWRWGYGMWAIVMFVSCLVLTTMMYIVDRKTKSTGHDKIIKSFEGLPEGNFFKKAGYYLFVKLDLFGGILMAVGLVLFFIPLTLTGKSSPYKWHEARLIALLVVGFVIFCLFLLWNTKFAKYPFVQHQALLQKTTLLACLIVALDWCENSAFSTYMKTVLQVSDYVTVGEASRIDNSKKACLQIFSVVGGLLMKYTKRSKLFVTSGIILLYLGHVLLVCFVNTGDGMAARPLLYMAEVFIGAGRGFYQCALQVIVQAVAGRHNIAMSTAFFLAFSSIGSLIGSAIAGSIWNTVILSKLNKYLPEDSKSNATKIYKSIKVALKYKKGTEERDAIAKAYRETQQIIGWATVGIITPMLIMMLFVHNVHLTDKADVYEDDTASEPDSVEDVTAKIGEEKKVPQGPTKLSLKQDIRQSLSNWRKKSVKQQILDAFGI